MNMTSDMAYTELFRLCGARVTPEQPLTTKQTAPLKASYFQRGGFLHLFASRQGRAGVQLTSACCTPHR